MQVWVYSKFQAGSLGIPGFYFPVKVFKTKQEAFQGKEDWGVARDDKEYYRKEGTKEAECVISVEMSE